MVKSTVVFLALLLSLSSTPPPSQTITPINQNLEEKQLYLNLHTEPPTLDPGIANDSTSGSVIRATFDGLTRTGQDGKTHPSVAEKVDVSNDLLTYTFTLRKSQWSNGDPVTAQDFIYAWKRILDSKNAMPNASQLFTIKNAEKAYKGQASLDDVGLRALNDHTFQVTLEHPTPYFLELTSFYTFFPVNSKVAKNPEWASDAKTHVGNGPFMLKSWEHKSKIELVKNPTYWDKNQVKLEQIHLWMIEDENTELAMFENGDLDWAGSPLSDLPIVAIDIFKEYGLVQEPVAGTYWYKFNTEQIPFNNSKIRKAFAYAIDRKEITNELLRAGQTPALGVLPPPMSVKDGGYFTDNNVGEARKLLAEGLKELGLKEMPPITLSFNTSEGHKNVAEIIRAQWMSSLGVDVKLTNQDWSIYIKNLEQGNFQVARMGWLADYNDPMTFLQQYKDKNDLNNYTGWENKQYHELLTLASREADSEKRKQLLQQAEQILMDEMPVIPLYFYSRNYVKNPRVQNVILDPLGGIDWKWASVE